MQVLSLFAFVCLSLYWDLTRRKQEPKEDFLLAARMSADEAAKLGFISEAVAQVGDGIPRGSEVARQFPHLMKAYDEYRAEMERKCQPITERFACSAACGIEASKLSGLRRCTGPCPLELKAYYCTSECHKLVSGHPYGSTPSLMLIGRTGSGTNSSVARTRPPRT